MRGYVSKDFPQVCHIFFHVVQNHETLTIVFCKIYFDYRLYKCPLEKICERENSCVPKAVSQLCEAIAKKAEEEEFVMEEFAMHLHTKEGSLVVDAYVNSCDSGHSSEIDLSDFSLVSLLLAVKKLISSFNTPLLTWTFSDVLCEHFEEHKCSKERVLMLKNVLERIPKIYFDTVFLLVDTLNSLCRDSFIEEKKELLAIFFEKCFLFPEEHSNGSEVLILMMDAWHMIATKLKFSEKREKSSKIFCNLQRRNSLITSHSGGNLRQMEKNSSHLSLPLVF